MPAKDVESATARQTKTAQTCKRSVPGEEVMSLFGDKSARALASLHCDLDQYLRMRDAQDRRLYLYGSIGVVDCDLFGDDSITAWLIEQIMMFNRIDKGTPPHEREPIRLYINSPGGDLVEGTALISVIELSKTPVYTINIGQWCSMAFLIGIAGKKRFSLPNATFLMHDGTSGAFGSTSKVQDQMEFERRFEKEVVKAHVLKHSTMKSVDYDALARVELYMLPGDAKERGFIDEIVDDIDKIL